MYVPLSLTHVIKGDAFYFQRHPKKWVYGWQLLWSQQILLAHIVKL